MTIETKPRLNIELADDVVAEVEKKIVTRLNIVKEINIEIIADDNFDNWQKEKEQLNCLLD
jgi:divalent metal cation (Fe/Co/Zn/Cd) transporter